MTQARKPSLDDGQKLPFLKRPFAFATLMLVIGAILVAGGGYLITQGGSPYYLLCGIAVLTSAALLLRGRREGAWLYAAMLVATLCWAIWEVGLNGWQLMPRLVGPFVLGLWLLAPWTRRSLVPGPVAKRIENWPRWSMIAILVAAGFIGLGLHQLRQLPPDPLYQAGRTDAPSPSTRAGEWAGEDWSIYGGDSAGTRFSDLVQITPDNVTQLEVAWSFRTGATPQGEKATIEAVPVVVDNRFYFCNSVNEIIALDATTGQQLWRFNPKVNWKPAGRAVCRGVSYHDTGADAETQCSRRIIGGTIDARLVAVDAVTGKPCEDFGEDGQISLLKGMGEVRPGYYFVSSAPTVVRGKIVIGGWVADGQYWGEPSGVIRAFDAVTGDFVWAFDVGRPDRTGEPPEGESFTPSTPNSWSVMSADEELGLVYAPMGNSVPDYYGAQRRPFDDSYSSGVLALDVETGRERWMFQTTHHDIWDYDVASQPTLLDIPESNGKVRKALIQPTKRAEVFVLDRETGKPIFDVQEIATPQDGVTPGERLSPTQPYSTGLPSFRGRDMLESDMWGVTPLDQMMCRIFFRTARYEGPMTPPGVKPWIQYPGYLGGSNWGSISINPDRMLMTIAVNHVANRNRMVPRAEADRMGLKPTPDVSRDVGGPVAQAGTPYAAHISPFFSPLVMPCQAPPYSTMSAVDLTTGKLVWTRDLGTSRDNGPLWIMLPLALPMGTPHIGGNINTRSGLTFMAGTTDSALRAFDTATGKMLWQAWLPGAGLSTPMTYRARDGRQMVAIAAAGFKPIGGRVSDKIVVFALPRDSGAITRKGD